MMKAKSIVKGLAFVLFLYVIYAVVTAVALFYLPIEKMDEASRSTAHVWKDQHSKDDRVLLLEDGYNSGIARIKMIQEARNSIDIAYYSIGKGESTDFVLGALFQAADRGVRVRVLLDGICHNLRGKRSDVRYALASHPNIQLKYYEPFTLLKPWTWNNRLHDKIMMADEDLAIIGGRNIGDKYLAKTPSDDFVYDRDTIVFNETQRKDSVIIPMKNYMNELWKHPYTKTVFQNLSEREKEKGERVRDRLKNKYQKAKEIQNEFVSPLFQWKTSTVPAHKVAFIHNPIERFHKTPFVWESLISLGKQAHTSIVIQSPYIVPTKNMEKYLPRKRNEKIETTVLTNSLISTPNALAFAGYMASRDRVVQTGTTLYEYGGLHSIHGKSIVYDQSLSVVGSFNIDSRSVFLNTESVLIIDSESFASELTKAIDDKVEHSALIAKDQQYVRKPYEEKRKAPFFKSAFLRVLSKMTVLWKELI